MRQRIDGGLLLGGERLDVPVLADRRHGLGRVADRTRRPGSQPRSVGVNGAPHWPQKLLPSGLSWPQLVQNGMRIRLSSWMASKRAEVAASRAESRTSTRFKVAES